MSRPMFDEMNASASSVRGHYQGYQRWLAKQSDDAMRARRAEAEMIFRRVGITFAVYGEKDEDGAGTERLIPFDLIPRIIPAHEWSSMEKGLTQRVTALNRFIHDIYHDQEILKAGIVPREQIEGNAQFRPEMMGVDVPGNIYSHISGADIVRVADVIVEVAAEFEPQLVSTLMDPFLPSTPALMPGCITTHLIQKGSKRRSSDNTAPPACLPRSLPRRCPPRSHTSPWTYRA